jgi:hypothetical protein
MQHATDSDESDDGYQSYAALYAAYDALLADKERDAEENKAARNALQRFLRHRTGGRQRDGFIRMQQCRDALDALDRQGWNRSFHQRMFHENFIRACARVFFKTEPQGSFARAHQAILDLNGWDNLSQEILISTPRRSALPRPNPISPLVERVAPRRRRVDGGLVVRADSHADRPAPRKVPRQNRGDLVVGRLPVEGLVPP